jgi:hypothetical protein
MSITPVSTETLNDAIENLSTRIREIGVRL